jgi:hypothetical protein
MFSTRIELVIQCFVAAGAMEAFFNLRVLTGLLNEVAKTLFTANM